MLSAFDSLAKKATSSLRNEKAFKSNQHQEAEECDALDDETRSNISEVIDIRQNFVQIGDMSNGSNTPKILGIRNSPLLYFFINVSLYSILIFLGMKRGYTVSELSYFKIHSSNVIIFEVYNIILLVLGVMIVIVLYNQLKTKLLMEKGYKDFISLDLVPLFGFCMIFFQFFECLVFLSSITLSRDKLDNTLLENSLHLASTLSTIMFTLGIVLVCSQLKKIQLNQKWFNYKVLVLIYLIFTTLIYLYSCCVVYQIIPNSFKISQETFDFMGFVLPYLLKLMCSFAILSTYDLFWNTHFSLSKIGEM